MKKTMMAARGPWVVVQPGIDGRSVATCSGKRKATGHDWEIKKY
ncbi:hypothetical protein [Nonomuraea aurantiaca]|nr:hypothetical protein [Nonomuraea aurantiaca]